MIVRPAQFLLRFDDLCPTMARACWQRFLPIIEEFGLRPILAVVPDNRDSGLIIDAQDPEFWEKMRAMEAAGAIIGLHGLHHLCASQGRSLLPFHRTSEFAGVPEATQSAWIRAGVKILRDRGLPPRSWVAPRHGFDRATLRALRREGIALVSDGLARIPFTRGGLTWIPQQLWAPTEKKRGVWTILLHSNTASEEQLRQLESFVRGHAAQFTSVDQVMAQLRPTWLMPIERLVEESQLLRLRCRRSVKWWLAR